MPLHPNEARARRDVLLMALKRLLGAPHRQYSRQELFTSPSTQSHKLSWQRDVLRVLRQDELISRSGPIKAPGYTVETDEQFNRLESLSKDVKALDELLRNAGSLSRGSVASADDGEMDHQVDPEGTTHDESGALTASETDIDPAAILQTVLKLTYGISESVISLLAQAEETTERLRRLEAIWCSEPDASPPPSTSVTNSNT